MTQRRFVFLGHANPHDNAFTLWLGARLVTSGYDVWSDLSQLQGGETFWNDIEDGLRKETAVYVPILSNASINRDRRGFHDEVAIAVQVMRAPGMERFILPVCIEKVSAIPPPLIQLNYIDFTAGWSHGLQRLFSALERAAVPRVAAVPTEAVAAWRGYQASMAGAALELAVPETLNSTWFSIESLPPRIRLIECAAPDDLWKPSLKATNVSYSLLNDKILTFASAEHLREQTKNTLPFKEVASFSTPVFLRGEARTEGPLVKPADAQRRVAAMLNAAWDAHASSRSLVRQKMSNSTAWSFPVGLYEGRTRFEKEAGGIGMRQMTGRNGKLGIRWHFALSARVELREPARLVVRTHVLFSTDGVSMVEKKAARLRRSLCKSWWNDEWRDRLQLAMTHLSLSGTGSLPLRNKGVLNLPLGGVSAVVAARSMRFESAASFQRVRRSEEAEDVSDYAFDEEVRAPEQPPGEDDDEGEE